MVIVEVASIPLSVDISMVDPPRVGRVSVGSVISLGGALEKLRVGRVIGGSDKPAGTVGRLSVGNVIVGNAVGGLAKLNVGKVNVGSVYADPGVSSVVAGLVVGPEDSGKPRVGNVNVGNVR